MAEENCVRHPGQKSVGHCSRCNKPYCFECLDVETGKVLCGDCRKGLPAAPAPSGNPAPFPASEPKTFPGLGASPLNFKGKGLEDDPLGLLGGADPSPAAKPSAPPPAPAVPSAEPGRSLPPVDFSPPGKAPPPLEKSGSPGAPLDLDALLSEPKPLRPPFPKSGGPQSAPPPMPAPSPAAAPAPAPAKAGQKSLAPVKSWAGSLPGKAYGFFTPAARKLRMPTYAFLALALLLLGGAAGGAALLLGPSSVGVVDSIQPLHIVEVNSEQVSEMDITAYSDLQNQLQSMGFTDLLQMTVPQLPSPNFFDVGLKEDAGTYSEILKMPGQLTPFLSFVTVFTNGVWFSTNAWKGKDVATNFRISAFYPGTAPDQLYIRHIQAVQKREREDGWQVEAMGEDRYMSALSDQIRGFLARKNIPAYQADFSLWH
jgi:hypothetical protein